MKKKPTFFPQSSGFFHFIRYILLTGFSHRDVLTAPPDMFDIVSVNRLFRFAALVLATLVLAAALLAQTGCRTLPSKSSTTSPTPTPISMTLPVPGAATPTSPVHSLQPASTEHYSAFRPIIPDEIAVYNPAVSTPAEPNPTVSTPIVPAPKCAVADPQTTALQTTISELNRKITELEMQLEETKREAGPLPIPVPPPIPWEDLMPDIAPKMESSEPLPTETLPTETLPNDHPVRPLPIVNKRGVQVYGDESRNIRIEIIDKALFVPNTWQLSAEGEEILRTVAAEISASDPDALIDIEGHTDSLMSDPNNNMQKHEISTAKTRAVLDFFVASLRWDASRISTSSFGRNRPVADNGTPEGRARNNRVEIVVHCE